jgi:hypothetical protein
MAKKVERFFATISFGKWSYRIDRTHSIVRIATTASPISGSDVRQQIERLRLSKRVLHSIHLIENAYLTYRQKKSQEHVATLIKYKEKSMSEHYPNGGDASNNSDEDTPVTVPTDPSQDW